LELNAGDGVGDGEKREIEQPLQMLGEHIGDLFHFRQIGFHRPAFPFFEEGSRFLKCAAFPKIPEVFLHAPSETGLEIGALEFLKLGRTAFGQVLGVEKEKMFCPLEAFVAFGLQDFVFLSADLIHSLVEVFGNMEAIVNHFAVPLVSGFESNGIKL
jgi:hypothetical protein